METEIPFDPSNRQHLIDYLQRFDSTGDYTDSDRIAQGLAPYTDEELLALFQAAWR